MRQPLHNLATIQLGYQPRGRIIDHPGGSYRFLRIQDLEHGTAIDVNSLPRIFPHRSPDRYQVRQDDVMFISRGPRLEAFLVRQPLDAVLAASLLYILRSGDAVLPAYLAWALNQPDAQAQIQRTARGTNIAMVRKSALAQVTIDVPALPVQQQIVRIADLAARERQLTARLLQQRERLASVVCRRAAAQDGRSPGNSGENG